MDLDRFLKNCQNYTVDELESGGYLAMLANSEYDIWFIYKDKEVTKYEIYWDLDDCFVYVDEAGLKKLENWLLKVLSESE